MWRKLEEELMIQCGEEMRKMLKNCETSLALTWYSMQDPNVHRSTVYNSQDMEAT